MRKGISFNIWKIFPIGSVLLFQLYRQISVNTLKIRWWSDLNLLVGWYLGWFLAEADHLVYATMCNPQELTCQRVKLEIDKKNWKVAWKMLQDTKAERTKLPIRNVLTLLAMTGMGIWVVSSSGSFLASGLIFGFCVRLFSELLMASDFKSWYWVFARDFSLQEHKGVMIATGLGIIWQWMYLIRG